MKLKCISVAAVAAGIALSLTNAWADAPAAKPGAMAGNQQVCLHQDQKYSLGAVLNGRVCSRGAMPGDMQWVPQEKPEVLTMQQEIDRTRMQAQLFHARIMLAEAEAKLSDMTFKMEQARK
jgi:hypothetical protein